MVSVIRKKYNDLILQASVKVLTHYLRNDDGHQLKHADMVIDRSLEIAQFIGYPHLDLVILAGYLHDVKVYENRKTHAELAYAYALSKEADDLFEGIAYDDRLLVAAAVGEHRASYKGEFSSILSEIISAGDRAAPEKVDELLKRVISTYSKNALTEEQKVEGSVAHIQEKYSRNGYARYPNCYKEFYKDKLEQFYQDVDKLVEKHRQSGTV